MTVKECYEIMKGDYDDVVSRLRTDERIKKFLLKVLSDPSFVQLCNAMAVKNIEEAFRAAHTLKGVCKNMSLTNLAYSASNLTEALRGRSEYGDDIEPLFKKVKKDYALTMACIQML
ncbi:MAG: Hpt domain-containing protein [Clostridia bacterium]|nr:Hpt domain-containing protein [Clostridia bacterium]